MIPKAMDYIRAWLLHIVEKCPESARTVWETCCQKHGAEAFEISQVRSIASDLTHTLDGKMQKRTA